jgi:uncharacterized phiE125 gp8 family phage protein
MPQKWTTVRLTAPQSLGVSVSEAKEHLRIAASDTEQDTLIQTLLEASIEKVQRDTGKQLITVAFRQDGCDFDMAGELKYGPAVSVTSVKYIDTDGVEHTLDPSVYVFDSGRQKIKLAFGQEWPEVADYDSAVSVNYVAGYGQDAGCVPRMLKAAVLLLTAQHFFEPDGGSYVSPANLNAYERIVDSLMRSSYP